MSLVRSKGWDESKGRGGKEVCAVSGHFRSIGKETESWPSCVALLDDVLLEAHPISYRASLFSGPIKC